ncbi:MAG TPA: protein phosphatase 2C domain-containing protein, partial [Chloroflexota bacterium]|nr:protein phosphatase 2C domain-containing protein [Chloroflexota bacterium]
EAALSQAMLAANLAVYTLAHGPEPSLHAMQTTLTAVVFSGRQLYIAHAGDTRVYLLRAGACMQLTGDHSEAAELLRLRLITPEQAVSHPRRSVLTRALGATPQLRPDFQRSPIQRGDRLLLCTDGLWGDLPLDELHQTLAAHPDAPASACAQLLARALERGGSDNVSLYVIDVVDPGPATPSAPSGRIGRLLAGLRGGG